MPPGFKALKIRALRLAMSMSLLSPRQMIAGPVLTSVDGLPTVHAIRRAGDAAIACSERQYRHLAFAAGGHACAGMSVARLEAQIAIPRLIQRFPRVQLVGTPVRGGRARFRGFRSLPAQVI